MKPDKVRWSEVCPACKGYPDQGACTCPSEVIARREARSAATPSRRRLSYLEWQWGRAILGLCMCVACYRSYCRAA